MSPDVLTSVINDQKITVYTGNQNYSHRMVLVSFFAVTNQLQLQYRISLSGYSRWTADEYEAWMNDAKPFGYEILDIKIGGVITRLKSTGYRIDNYLNGNVLRLEELEEERLPYFTKGMDKRENLWNRIISGCDLNDTI